MPSAPGSQLKAKPTLRDRLSTDALFKTSADLPRIVELDLAQVEPDPDQPRRTIDPDGINELAASIAKHGLLQPILVRRGAAPGRWVVVAGERRFQASRALGRPTIAAIVTDGDPLEVALVENLQREALDPFEEGAAIGRLMVERGWTQEEVGSAVGKRQNTISALLSLARLPDSIRAGYRAQPGRVGRSLLVELAQIEDPATQLRLWELAKDGLATVRTVRAERGRAARPTATPRSVEPLAAEGRRLLARLGGVDGLDQPTRSVLAELHAALGRLLARELSDVG